MTFVVKYPESKYERGSLRPYQAKILVMQEQGTPAVILSAGSHSIGHDHQTPWKIPCKLPEHLHASFDTGEQLVATSPCTRSHPVCRSFTEVQYTDIQFPEII